MTLEYSTTKKHLVVGPKTAEEHLSLTLVGERIKAQREKLGLTQVELGREMNVTKQTISHYENGEQKFSRTSTFNTISKFAKHLSCSIEYLTGDVDAPNKQLITWLGQRIYPESLGYLSDEEQQEIMAEYNHCKDNGEFPNSKTFKSLDITREYTRIPIVDEKCTNHLDSIQKDSHAEMSCAPDGTIYFYNVKNSTAVCLEIADKQKPGTLYEIQNPKFSYNFPPILEQVSFPNHLDNNHQDFLNFINIVNISQRNNKFSDYTKKFVTILAMSAISKDTDDDQCIKSFLEHYGTHKTLLKVFFNLLEIFPENNFHQIEKELCNIKKRILQNINEE